jgi:uncharacterized OB-fold protein
MADEGAGTIKVLAPFIRLDAEDRPFLEGVRCGACGEVLAIEPRRACPRCAAIDSLEPARLAEHGRLYAYTVVHRSFPGVKVPFVAAVVDLHGGGSIKGNLVGVELDAISFDMPLNVEFERLQPREDSNERHIRHFFTPGAN